jgi:CBS-domain-containing membrane protein
MLIRDIMLTDPVTASIDARLPQLLRLLQRHGFRHVPIVDADKVVGIVSDRDIKQSMTSAALSTAGAKREHLLGELTAGDIINGERELVLRLATIDPGPAIQALEARGYIVRPAGRQTPSLSGL